MSYLLRAKCPSCGHVFDAAPNNPCPKCGTMFQLPQDGVLQIYRMGNFFGAAVGYGIYINGIPYGHLANQQSVRIPLPYGRYSIHFTCGTVRRCQDAIIDLTPQNRFAYIKGRIKTGFWSHSLVAEHARAEDMPQI